MRFTKQLTALACALGLWVGGAHASEPNTCENKDSWTEAEKFKAMFAGLFGGQTPCETIGYTTTAAYKALKTIETGPTVEVMSKALAKTPLVSKILAKRLVTNPSHYPSYKLGKTKILGITADGQKTWVYCTTTCTPGSLNRVSIQQGLPFMVPYGMLRLVEEVDDTPSRTKTWHDVAAIIWSEEFAEETDDRNAQLARVEQVYHPETHANRREAKIISDNKQQNNGASDIKVTADGTTDDVVEVAAEDCDAMCLSERM